MSADEVSNVLEEAQTLPDNLAVGNKEEGVPTTGGSNPIAIDCFLIDDVLDASPLRQLNIIHACTKIKEGEDPLSNIDMRLPLRPVPHLNNGNSIAISQMNNTPRSTITPFSDVKHLLS